MGDYIALPEIFQVPVLIKAFTLNHAQKGGPTSSVATGGGWRFHPSPVEPQMTSYIIVTGQKYDKLSLKIVQKALKWPL